MKKLLIVMVLLLTACQAAQPAQEYIETVPVLESAQPAQEYIETVPVLESAQPAQEIFDVCPNLEGDQPFVPQGLEIDMSGSCVLAGIFICHSTPNGELITMHFDDPYHLVESGYVADDGSVTDHFNNIGTCEGTEPEGLVYDWCLNITGAQSKIPDQLKLTAEGCVIR